MSTYLEILVLLLMILASGFFAMSEMALVSARRARLQQLAEEGNPRARRTLELVSSANRFLATAQIGITLVGVLAGAFGGVTLAERLDPHLQTIPWLQPYSHPLSVGLVVIFTTYLTLTLGELVPKRIGMSRPEALAMRVSGPMGGLSRLAAPLVWVLGISTEGVLRLLGVRPSAEPPVTEGEIRILLEQGEKAGVFEEAELALVQRSLRLNRRRISGIMTPRPDVVWLDLEDPPEEFRRRLVTEPYSRFPVCRGSLDEVAGILQVKDYLTQVLAGEPEDFETILREVLFVPESMPALQALESFERAGRHIALVVDEYGGVQGLVTMNDILGAIVGEGAATEGPEEPEAVRREDGSWLLDGVLSVEELRELLDLPPLPGEERGSFTTLGGFVMSQMGRIPAPAETFDWADYHFEVLDMDGHRVDKVLVTPHTKDTAEEP
ncbi:MAG TPA: hemolysin family protein [Armatimonadota bacterium]|jgi:putative hemolysin